MGELLRLLYFNYSLEVCSTIKSLEVLLSERNDSVSESVNREVSSLVCSFTTFILVSFLSDDDVTSNCRLSTEDFDSSILRL